MRKPAVPTGHFRTLSLAAVFNRSRSELPALLRPPVADEAFGERTIRGIPFAFGLADGKNVVVLDSSSLRIDLPEVTATYCIFVHAVADAPTNYGVEFSDSAADGNQVGGVVSEYSLVYVDGSSVAVPVLRRFAIQQSRIGVGASAFAAVPARDDRVVRSVAEDIAVAGTSTHGYFDGQVRHESGRDAAMRLAFPAEMLWMYALPNPDPKRPLAAVVLNPRDEVSAVYAVTLTTLADHPLRAGTRRRALLRLPERSHLNAIGELDGVTVDLGTVISARAARDYDPVRWLGNEPLVKPARSGQSVVVEFAAHPEATLSVANEAVQGHDIKMLPASDKPVRVRIVEGETGAAAPARVHFHGQAGEYFPPRGHHRKVNTALFEDTFAELAVDDHQFAYVDGDCIVDLPIGTVFVSRSMPARRSSDSSSPGRSAGANEVG